ncbi:hypothetical protein JCM3770_007126 [Rhodotorula araucariae]
MSLAYLASWFPSLPSSTSGPAAQPTKQLTEEQLSDLHAQWLHMQAAHQAEAQRLLGKLVGENNELRERLDKAERDLKDIRAGRRADEAALRTAEEEIAKLTGGGMGLAVGILDLEADLFSPQILNQQDSAVAASDALHRLLLDSMCSLPPPMLTRSWQFIAFVFWHRNDRFVQQLISNGVFASIRDFDAFISKFNRTHPLFMLIVDSGSQEQTRQRARAFAVLFARDPLCHRLLLGRSRFVEPYIGFYLPAQLLRSNPQTISVEGVLRVHPLTEGQDHEVDYSRPLSQQDPPICLDHYLSATRCSDERCALSHSYRIPPDVLQAFRFELRRTPCPLVLAEYKCLDGARCHFTHVCPRGARCSTQTCEFTAPDMHPFPVPPTRKQTVSAAGPHPAYAPPPPAAPAASPSSVWRATPRKAGSKLHHLRPSSPFGHPLSLADAVAASVPSAPVPDAVHLTGDELARLLAKVRAEEREYARGLGEDPFLSRPPPSFA